jgi:CheY-like chemotaxis protein
MSAAAVPNLATHHALAGRRVLVAEDSLTTMRSWNCCSQRGHHVDIATDGKQALQALLHNH